MSKSKQARFGIKFSGVAFDMVDVAASRLKNKPAFIATEKEREAAIQEVIDLVGRKAYCRLEASFGDYSALLAAEAYLQGLRDAVTVKRILDGELTIMDIMPEAAEDLDDSKL